MNLREVYLLGHRMSYIRLAILASWPVKKVGEDPYIRDSLKLILLSLEKNDIVTSIHPGIKEWIDKLGKYKDGVSLSKTDEDSLYSDHVRWDDRIRNELSSTPILCLYKKGMLNYEHLQSGAKVFFQEEVWERLSDISKSDLDDAAKCLLCELPTPAAMISLRATEDVIRQYYKHKTKKNSGRKRWKQLLDELLSKDSSKNYRYKVDTTLVGHLDYIRENKRNVAEHPDKIFSQREAESIFFQVVTTISEIYGDMPARKRKSKK